MANVKTLEEHLRLKSYLLEKTWNEVEFHQTYPDEYRFCIFCWAHISERLCDYGEGFHEEESDSWVCHDCMKKYQEPFRWKIIPMKRKTIYEIFAEQEDLEIPML